MELYIEFRQLNGFRQRKCIFPFLPWVFTFETYSSDQEANCLIYKYGFAKLGMWSRLQVGKSANNVTAWNFNH